MAHSEKTKKGGSTGKAGPVAYSKMMREHGRNMTHAMNQSKSGSKRSK